MWFTLFVLNHRSQSFKFACTSRDRNRHTLQFFLRACLFTVERILHAGCYGMMSKPRQTPMNVLPILGWKNLLKAEMVKSWHTPLWKSTLLFPTRSKTLLSFLKDSLSHLTLTYESLKHKKAPNSRYESVWLATHKDSLTKNQFCIVTFFVIVTKAHIFFLFLRKRTKQRLHRRAERCIWPVSPSIHCLPKPHQKWAQVKGTNWSHS